MAKVSKDDEFQGTDGERALRQAADDAEEARLEAAEHGIVAAPMTGDYAAARLAAKQNPLRSDDPAADVVDRVKAAGDEVRERAAEVRRNASQNRSEPPAARRSRADVVAGSGDNPPTGGGRTGGAAKS